MELKIDLVDSVQPEPFYTDLDYQKYSVKDDHGKFITHVFGFKTGFLNLKTSKYFDTVEQAARAAVSK